MFRALGRFMGGYAFSRRDLQLLYAAIFLSFFGTSVTFPLRMLYAQKHGASPEELGLMASSFLVAPLIAQFPMGWLVDRWGRVPVLVFALVTHTIVSFLYIPLNTPVDLIALRFVEGIIVSAFQPAINAYIADVTPEEHRPEAYGALSATLSGGMLIGPVIGGVVGQTLGIQAAFVMNGLIEAAAIPLVLGHVHEPRVHESHGVVTAPATLRDLFTLPLIAVYVAFFAVQTVMGMLTSLWAVWVHDIGGSYFYIGLTFTVFALPQIFLGARAGKLGQQWGRAPVLLISGLLAGIIYASYGFMTDLVLIMVVGVIEGMVIVFQQPVAQGFMADASPPDARGRVQGISGATGAIGGAIAAFASFPLYHINRPLPFVAAGAVMAAGACVAAAGAVVFARREREVEPEYGETVHAIGS